MKVARCRSAYTLIGSQDAADDVQGSSSVGGTIAISIRHNSTSNLPCHHNHLVSLLKTSKSSEPLKGDAHEANTFCNYQLSELRISA
jgi:hypothetical protein